MYFTQSLLVLQYLRIGLPSRVYLTNLFSFSNVFIFFRMFYGPGGPYALFAGRDASRALAKMSFEKEDLTGDISGLGPFEIDALQDWEYKFMSKYVKVGAIKKTVPVTDGSTPTETSDVIETKITEDAPKESPVESSHDKEVPSEEAAVAKE